MDRAAEPLAEVSKVNASFAMSVFDTEELLEIFVF